MEIMRHLLGFVTFTEIFAMPWTKWSLATLMGIDPREARWFKDDQDIYVPFRNGKINLMPKNILVEGQIYMASLHEWVSVKKICYSPVEYHRLFYRTETADMVPRIVCDENSPVPCVIMYMGKRRLASDMVFEKGREMDVMDSLGMWWRSRIEEIAGNKVRFHFYGWDAKWDEWYAMDSFHIAPPGSVVLDWVQKLKIGDLVDFKKIHRWFQGHIVHISEQGLTVREEEDPKEWIIGWESDRIMYRGAHTFPRQNMKYAVWQDEKGTDMFLFVRRNCPVRLVDRLLSEAEKMTLFWN